MTNKLPVYTEPVSTEKKCMRTSLIIGAYFLLSSLVYFLNPLRLTEEIHSGFIGFILGLGNIGEVIDEYFADYSILNLISAVSVVWIIGLAITLIGIILAVIKRTRFLTHYFLFTGGLVLLIGSLISVIGAGYYNAVDSEALKGMIFVDMPLGAMVGLLAAGAMCVSSGWVLYENIKDYFKKSREQVQKPGRLRALSYDESRPRSYLRGTAGALLGMLLGGLPWILLIVFNIFGAFFGISIGLLARLFYELAGGKKGGIKNVILFSVAILGIPIVEVLGYSAQAAYYILSGEVVRKSFFDLWGDFLYTLSSTPSALVTILVDTGVGMLFAAICVSGIFSRKKDI